MKKKVYSVLKPKVSAFGFNKEELMGIAADIANNLTLTEEATDEEIDEAINKEVESVIPYLKYSQSQANRAIENWKKNNPKDAPDTKEKEERKENVKEKSEAEGNETLKLMAESLRLIQEKLNNLEAEKTTNSRRSKLEKLLDGKGVFAQSKLRDFDRMKFDKDEDFEVFCEEIEDDLKSLVQESANGGLSKLTPPQDANSKKDEVMSDDEIASLADNM